MLRWDRSKHVPERVPSKDGDTSHSEDGEGLLLSSSPSHIHEDDPEPFWSLMLLLWSLGMVLVLGFLITYFALQPHSHSSSSSSPVSIEESSDGSVILLGDSLIEKPVSEFNLIHLIQSNISHASFAYTALGRGGDTIQRIRERLPPLLSFIASEKKRLAVEEPNEDYPFLVLMLWDSDASDTDFTIFTNNELSLIYSNYIMNVKYVVQSLIDVGAQVLGISGPGLMEFNPEKSALLDTYAAMNRAVCEDFNMTYMDIRTPFLAALEQGDDPTEDGEHPSEKGAQIIAQLFSDTLNTWLRKQSAKY